MIGGLTVLAAVLFLPDAGGLRDRPIVHPLAALPAFLIAFQRVRFWKENEESISEAWDQAQQWQTPGHRRLDLVLIPNLLPGRRIKPVRDQFSLTPVCSSGWWQCGQRKRGGPVDRRATRGLTLKASVALVAAGAGRHPA